MRDHAREIIRKEIDLSEADVLSLEKGIFNWCIAYAREHGITKNWDNFLFTNLYSSKLRSIVANLDPTSYIQNERLIVRLKENEFDVYNLVFMDRKNMFPEVWKEIVEDKMKRDSNIGEQITPMTNQYKCRRCHKREIVYRELQTRSADEPASLFFMCLNCGNTWRIG
jgi:DNA-directed RNA polymerase subunit M/transcription elongation factor TFIIS